MSQQKGALKKQDNKIHKLKLNPMMKKVLVFLSVLFIITICILLLCNYIEKKSLKDNSLSKIPFSNNLYFCSVKSNVHNLNYKKGTMLILSKANNYNIGQKVFLKNKYPNKQNEAINQKYLIGIIKEEKKNGYSVLLSTKDEIVNFNENDIIAKVNSSISFIGYIYISMVGVQGYIFFGIVPLLFIVLVYFIMRYMTISKCLKQISQKSFESEEPLKIVAQTVRSVSNPKSLYIIDCEDDVKLYKAESKEKKDHIIKEKSSFINEIVEEKIPISNEFKTNPIIKRRKKSFKIINKFKLEESFEKVSQSDILSYSEDENINKKEDDNLTVDDIIAQYRKQNPEKPTKDNESDEKLRDIAKFYYDNNIENYL